MNLKHLITNKGLGWGLIIAFSLLYLGVGFVSTLHSITFFQLANSLGLAILLGLTYEVGQAAVLFSLLMTKNKDKFLPWFLMILLTSLQVTANVYSSFLYMAKSGSTDWVYWQKSILFGVQASSPEMYQIIIAWIAGALLPLVALGMTALIAENMKMLSEEYESDTPKVGTIPDEEVDEIINNEVAKRIAQPEPEQDVYDPEREAFDNYVRDMKVLNDNNKPHNFDITTETLQPQVVVDIDAERRKAYADQGVAGHEHGDMHGVHGLAMPGELQGMPGTTGIIESPGMFDATPAIEPPPLTGSQELHQTLREIYDEVNAEDYIPKPEPKKEPELLPSEEVKVPSKPERFVNPLLRKSRIEKISAKDLNKPSKGDEVIALIEKQEKARDKGTIKHTEEEALRAHESLLVPPDILTPYLQGGVEVIDAKAIQKRT